MFFIFRDESIIAAIGTKGGKRGFRFDAPKNSAIFTIFYNGITSLKNNFPGIDVITVGFCLYLTSVLIK